MKASNFLHQLIHALSKDEKDRFRKSLESGKKGKSSLYLQLFVALDSQKSYDEPAIKRKFEGSSFGKSLAFPKSHLYDRVLDFLFQQSCVETVGTNFRKQLTVIELLADKGLPEQALRLIDKSLTLALALEDATTILQLLKIKRRQIMRLQSQHLLSEMLRISELEEEWEQMYLNEQAATRLHDQCYALFQEVRRKASAKDDPALKTLSQQLDRLLNAAKLNFAAKTVALRAYSHVHHMREDFAAVHNAYKAEIEVWEANPHQIQHAQLRYVRLIGQWLTSKALIKDHEGLFSEIKRLRRHNDLNANGKAEVFQVTYSLEMYYYLNQGQADKALPIVEAITKGLAQFDQQLPPSTKLAFYYNLTLVNWISGQTAQALKWLQEIQHFDNQSVRKDIRTFAPILEKVLHFELGNTNILESWFRALKYKQKKQAESIGLESILATLLYTLLNNSDKSTETKAFSTFVQHLETFAQKPGISKLGIQELKDWARR